MAAGSNKVIYAALIGNTLIAITKFFASFYTGSSAMMSEAIHSVVDTGNQGLLLYGIHRSRRPADSTHPFGYGAEIYFWAFVVAIMIFGLGAGLSFYEGVQKLLQPHPISSPLINYIVLALAMVFEATAWIIAYREFGKTMGKQGLFSAVERSKDPTVFTVLFEDTAAMLGLVAAFAGVAAVDQLGWEWADGAASIVIAAILAIAAILLARETKGLLIGEAAGPPVVNGIQGLLKAEKSLRTINELRTLHLGPREILLAVSVDFVDGVSSQEIEAKIGRLERQIKRRYPDIRRVFIEVQSRADHERDEREEAKAEAQGQ